MSSPSSLLPNESDEAILERHLKKCPFKEGDYVVFKKPRSRKITGQIVHIERNPDNVMWNHNLSVPLYIAVMLDKPHPALSDRLGIAHTYAKKLLIDRSAKK